MPRTINQAEYNTLRDALRRVLEKSVENVYRPHHSRSTGHFFGNVSLLEFELAQDEIYANATERAHDLSELRSLLQRRSRLLHRDGIIVDVNGSKIELTLSLKGNSDDD